MSAKSQHTHSNCPLLKHIVGASAKSRERVLTPLHSAAAAAAFVWLFVHPHSSSNVLDTNLLRLPMKIECILSPSCSAAIKPSLSIPLSLATLCPSLFPPPPPPVLPYLSSQSILSPHTNPHNNIKIKSFTNSRQATFHFTSSRSLTLGSTPQHALYH